MKIPAIDVLRGLAALGVAWYHSRVDLWVGFSEIHNHPEDYSVWDRIMSWASLPVSQLGSLVMLFFVLSGFCIHLPLAGKGRLVDWSPYLIRRMLRIYPAYLLTLVLCYLAMVGLNHWFGGVLPDDLSYLLSAGLIQNWFSDTGQVAMNPSLWSIPVEVELYLVYPLLLMVYVTYGFRASLLFTIICTGIGWLFYFQGAGIAAGSFFKYAIIWNCGAWLAECYAKNQIPRWTRWHTLVAAATAIGTPALGLAGADHFYLDYGWGLFSLLLLWWLITDGAHWLPADASWLKPLTVLGTISYSLYLIHFPLFKIGGTIWINVFGSEPTNFIVPTLATLSVIPVAWCFYKLVECPSHSWARRLARSPSTLTVPSFSFFPLLGPKHSCATCIGTTVDSMDRRIHSQDGAESISVRSALPQIRGCNTMQADVMNIVFLVHPSWMQSASMPRLARMFGEGMKTKGHRVSYWTSKSIFGRFVTRSRILKKWLGYLDQYVIYRWALSRNVKQQPRDTIFVVTDQALGIWVPSIKDRPHVIHCNDFLALRSALDQFPENRTKWSGKVYQHLIRRGFSKGAHFVSISHATDEDLKRLTFGKPRSAEAIHLGLNGDFRPMDREDAIETLSSRLDGEQETGMLMHVGGSQWYKNRRGVIELYRQWATQTDSPVPLWMIGTEPEPALVEAAQNIPNGGKVRFMTGCSNEEVIAAYNLSLLLLFPSLEEGFGWPIAEALACGTLVMTTDAAPMTEVGGEAASYFRRWHASDPTWAEDGAKLIEELVSLSAEERQRRVQKGIEYANRFKTGNALDAYEKIYQRVLQSWDTELELAQ